MVNNIIIYTRPEVLLHKMGMLPNPDDKEDMAFGKRCDFFWTLNNRPNNIDKVYFATKGCIIGYFRVNECEDDENDFSWTAESWAVLEEPIPTKSFQGFKYANKIPELIEQGEEKNP